MKLKIQRPRGMRDVVYPESEFYLKIRELAVNFSLIQGFKYIETPIVEDIKTFTLSLGEASDVVMKEMFVIKGREKGSSYVLRPEGTAGVVRAYFENGMASLSQPISLFYFGKMYRRERPQAGRFREHTQWGLEILNTPDAFADFFVIYSFYKFLTKLKIGDLVIKLNSLGCERCRPRYKKHLVKYYKQYKNKICPDCQRRLKLNPLRLLDCKDSRDQEHKINAPNILDHLCKSCEEHLQKVIEFLEHFKIPYDLDKTLVRGFDYYQRTVFEIFVSEEKIALAGGGRYDLGPILANQSLPSVGGALGIERLKIILDELNLGFKYPQPKIFITFAGEEVRLKAFEIYLQLQDAGYNPVGNFFKTSLSSQLEVANKIGVKYSLILGFQELGKGEIILKDMEYGNQEILKIKSLVQELKRFLKHK
ncbi:MAG: histidine--tRNA ligase [Candidatus Parcubacteria bacterium]|nr:MAG: histidine--tRNA ligase [Candidatus Parcubacteria bacterium]